MNTDGICTSTPHCFEGKGAVQEFDSRDMYHSITKWRGYCTITRRVPEYVATAFRYANTGRKGPVLLDFPDDTLVVARDRLLELGTVPLEDVCSRLTEAGRVLQDYAERLSGMEVILPVLGKTIEIS